MTEAGLHPAAVRALSEAGRTPGPVIGAGMEGTVVALGDDLVAKAWHSRARADLERLRTFYAALRAGGVGLATPDIHRVLECEGRTVTVETRLGGNPLRSAMDDGEHRITDREVAAVLTVLRALRDVEPDPALWCLPVLEGEPPFDPATPFADDLAALVERRFPGAGDVLRRRVPDVDRLVARVAERLRGLAVPTVGVVHGDLVPANVLVTEGTASGVLDFGFLSTYGDPRFDAAVAAGVHDMYGVHARETEAELDAALVAELGYDGAVLHLYRAAYALVTCTSFSASGSDGHFEWCARVLERDDVREAL